MQTCTEQQVYRTCCDNQNGLPGYQKQLRVVSCSGRPQWRQILPWAQRSTNYNGRKPAAPFACFCSASRHRDVRILASRSDDRALFAVVHVQGCMPKLSRVSLSQARIAALQALELPPFSPAKQVLRVDSSQVSRGKLSYWTQGRVRCSVVRSLSFAFVSLLLHFAFPNLRDQHLQGIGLLPALVHATPSS